MKKILMIALAITLFAVPAFAAATFTTGGQAITAGSETLSTLSNKVNAALTSDANRFSAATFHQSGSKAFASASTSTKIYSNTATGLPTLTNSDTADFSTWTAL